MHDDLFGLGLHVGASQPLDVGADGRAHENRLVILLDAAEDFLDVVAEADVEHAIDFIEDDVLDVLEVDVPAFEHVHDAAWRADDDLAAFFELGSLRLDALAAVDGDGADGGEAADVFDFAGDLNGELARGGEDEGLEGDVALELAEERDAEGGGFAGAGFGLADDIATFHDGGDEAGLGLGGIFEAAGFDALHDAVAQAQVGEGFGGVEGVGEITVACGFLGRGGVFDFADVDGGGEVAGVGRAVVGVVGVGGAISGVVGGGLGVVVEQSVEVVHGEGLGYELGFDALDVIGRAREAGASCGHGEYVQSVVRALLTNDNDFQRGFLKWEVTEERSRHSAWGDKHDRGGCLLPDAECRFSIFRAEPLRVMKLAGAEPVEKLSLDSRRAGFVGMGVRFASAMGVCGCAMVGDALYWRCLPHGSGVESFGFGAD